MSGSTGSSPLGSVCFEPVPPSRSVSLGRLILVSGIQLQGERHPGRPVRVPDEHRVDQSRAHWSRLVGEWLPREQNWFQPGSSQGGFAKLSVYGEESKGRFAGL